MRVIGGAPSIGARLDENFILLFFFTYMTEAVGFVEVPLAGFAKSIMPRTIAKRYKL